VVLLKLLIVKLRNILQDITLNATELTLNEIARPDFGRHGHFDFYLRDPLHHSTLERAAFGLGRAKGSGSDDNLLQKIRNLVKLAP
jgi:hypothetical protein